MSNMTRKDIILEARDITLRKGEKNLLSKVSFSVEKGKIHAILGPNGAGKSTLAYMIMGLKDYRNIDGSLIFENNKINQLSVTERAKYGITLAWQEPARIEGVTVKDYLGISSKEKDEKEIDKALNMVDLNPKRYLKRNIDTTLSGGERKRIELASIILMKPKLVILDEPDSGIDLNAIDKVLETITYLKNIGTTVLLITHSLKILELADTANLICNGIIKDAGTPEIIRKYFDTRCQLCNRNDMNGDDE